MTTKKTKTPRAASIANDDNGEVAQEQPVRPRIDFAAAYRAIAAKQKKGSPEWAETMLLAIGAPGSPAPPETLDEMDCENDFVM